VPKSPLSTFAQIRALSAKQSLAFSVAVLTRMVPHVVIYDELIAPAENAALAEAPVSNELGPLAHKVLGLLWDYLINHKAKFNYGVQLEKIESMTPDIGPDTPFGVLPAMDACIGLASVLRLIQHEQDDAAVIISKLAQGGIEAMLLATEFSEQNDRVLAIDDPEAQDNAHFALSKALKAHPLMEFEIQYQQHVLEYVTTHSLDAAGMKALYDMTQETGITTLGIELTSE
jgi:uncharacterized protein YjaG (DUF416 family)